MSADVGKPTDAQALVERAAAHCGRLDLACNNAGIGGPTALPADHPLEGWAQVININLSGVSYGMQQQIAAMPKTGGGAIVNTASVLGAVGLATSSACTAVKHGVVGLTQAAARGRPEEVAELVAWLAPDRAPFVTGSTTRWMAAIWRGDPPSVLASHRRSHVESTR